MGNTPEELIELAKASFPRPILVLTSSDNGRLWSLSASSKPLPWLNRLGRFRPQTQGMKFRGPSWEKDVWPVLVECARVLKPGGYGVFWGLHRTTHWLSWGLEDAGLSVLDILARRVAVQRMKSPVVKGRYSTQVARETEFWVLVRKPGSEPTASTNKEKWGTGYLDHGIQPARLTNLIEGFPVNRHTTKHPAEKSLKWMETLVKMITPKGGVVLDPFMGSGTTGVAAVNSGFRFLGCEKDSAWYELAKQRVSELRPRP